MSLRRSLKRLLRGKERRRAPRQTADIPVIVVRDSPFLSSPARVVDFSKQGYCIEHPVPLNVGDAVRILGEASETSARIAWTRRSNEKHLSGIQVIAVRHTREADEGESTASQNSR